jgi:hypothetical protein
VGFNIVTRGLEIILKTLTYLFPYFGMELAPLHITSILCGLPRLHRASPSAFLDKIKKKNLRKDKFTKRKYPNKNCKKNVRQNQINLSYFFNSVVYPNFIASK